MWLLALAEDTYDTSGSPGNSCPGCNGIAVAISTVQSAELMVMNHSVTSRRGIRRTVLAGVAGAIVISFAGFALKQALFGDTTVPHASTQIRFGPNNTNDKR